ncbi:MAG: zf-TFIIB domain-containing protein [Myxococcota bacterium]
MAPSGATGSRCQSRLRAPHAASGLAECSGAAAGWCKALESTTQTSQRVRAPAAATAKQNANDPLRTLACPHCHAPLRRRVVLDVEVDECPACKTAWFDEGELDTVLRGRAGVGIDTLGPSAAPDPTHGRCPVCPRSTKSFRFHAAPTARVQACPGHGEWVEESDGRTMIRWASREAVKVEASYRGHYLRRIAGLLIGWTRSPNPVLIAVLWFITRDVMAAVGLALVIQWASARWARRRSLARHASTPCEHGA